MSKILHTGLALDVLPAKPDAVYLIGEVVKSLHDRIVSSAKSTHVGGAKYLAELPRNELSSGDVLLVKVCTVWACTNWSVRKNPRTRSLPIGAGNEPWWHDLTASEPCTIGLTVETPSPNATKITRLTTEMVTSVSAAAPQNEENRCKNLTYNLCIG